MFKHATLSGECKNIHISQPVVYLKAARRRPPPPILSLVLECDNCPPPLFCQPQIFKRIKTTIGKSMYRNMAEICSYLSGYCKSQIY